MRHFRDIIEISSQFSENKIWKGITSHEVLADIITSSDRRWRAILGMVAVTVPIGEVTDRNTVICSSVLLVNLGQVPGTGEH